VRLELLMRDEITTHVCEHVIELVTESVDIGVLASRTLWTLRTDKTARSLGTLLALTGSVGTQCPDLFEDFLAKCLKGLIVLCEHDPERVDLTLELVPTRV